MTFQNPLKDPYVQALEEPSGQADGFPAHFTCTECDGGDAAFASREDFTLHLEEEHPKSQLLRSDRAPAKNTLIHQSRSSKHILENLSGRQSPAISESRNSEDITGAVRPSSIAAACGSRDPSRSPPSSDGEGNKAGSRAKRPFTADSNVEEHLAKHHVRDSAARAISQSSAPRTPSGLRTIQIEDVDPTFRRSPTSQPYDLYEPAARQTRISPNKEGIGTPKPPPSHVARGVPPVLAQPQPTSPQPGHGNGTTSNSSSPPSSRPSSSAGRPAGVLNLRYKPQWPTLALQPQSRPVFQEHLSAEVKSIYTGLTQVESKCVQIDRVQQATPRSESRITDDHWQAMIALHRTLLHEHHDFFLASQHPAASSALKRLAIKYSMPARMWKHGIHSFLELLRHRLPESLEYMLAFIYLAYQMIALLYETVPAFRNTWIECLGDLGRYRMAVEDENVRDREIWAGVARSWYNKAADTNPAIGRLFHHLAILARPNMVQQLYLYNRSLTSVMPFLNARESIVTIFDPVMTQSSAPQISKIDLALVKIHAHLFKGESLDSIQALLDSIVDDLPSHIQHMGEKWLHIGAYIAIANIGALFDYGNEKNRVRFIFDHRRKEIQEQDPKTLPPGLPEDQSVPNPRSLPALDTNSAEAFQNSINLIFSIFKVVLSRKSDKNVLPFVHVVLVFVLHVIEISESHFASTTAAILSAVPWNDLVSFANDTLTKAEDDDASAFQQSIVFESNGRPLPEDWMLRGLNWSFNYTPRTWFKDAAVTEEEERYMELTSTMKARVDRVHSLAVELAESQNQKWYKYDSKMNWFALANQDVAMPDPHEGYGTSEDSPLMVTLMERELKKNARGEAYTQSECVTHIQREYNSLIVDAGVLLNEHRLFDRLLDIGLPMVVPREAADELLKAHADDEPVSALASLCRAMRTRGDIRIKTSTGEDVTEKYKSLLQDAFPTPLRTTEAPARFAGSIKSRVNVIKANSEEMLGLVRRESGLSSFSRSDTLPSVFSVQSVDTEMTEPDTEDDSTSKVARDQAGPKRPLLVTDDRRLRVQVSRSFGTAAIATYMVKKWLVQTRKNSPVQDQADQTAMDVDMPTQTAAATQ